MVLDHVMAPAVVGMVLAEYQAHGTWEPYGGYHEGKSSGAGILITHPEIIGQSVARQTISQHVVNCLSQAFQRYLEEFSGLKEYGQGFYGIDKCMAPRLLRYLPGEQFPLHVDKHPAMAASGMGWPLISCSMMLNDDYEGGAFELFGGGQVIAPRAGRVVLFPSSFMYPHKITPITRGVRYVVVGWAY